MPKTCALGVKQPVILSVAVSGNFGLNNLSSDFQTELNKAYRNAVKKKGLWKNTYASKNSTEYWAMAVQIWFNVNYSTTDANENYIRTKAQLKYYDPVIYDLVARYMPDKPILIC